MPLFDIPDKAKLGLGILGAGLGFFGGRNSSDPASSDQTTLGYQGEITDYSLVREQVLDTSDPLMRPGARGKRYFSDARFVPTGDAGIPSLRQDLFDQANVGPDSLRAQNYARQGLIAPDLPEDSGPSGIDSVLGMPLDYSSRGLPGLTQGATYTMEDVTDPNRMQYYRDGTVYIPGYGFINAYDPASLAAYTSGALQEAEVVSSEQEGTEEESPEGGEADPEAEAGTPPAGEGTPPEGEDTPAGEGTPPEGESTAERERRERRENPILTPQEDPESAYYSKSYFGEGRASVTGSTFSTPYQNYQWYTDPTPEGEINPYTGEPYKPNTVFANSLNNPNVPIERREEAREYIIFDGSERKAILVPWGMLSDKRREAITAIIEQNISAAERERQLGSYFAAEIGSMPTAEEAIARRQAEFEERETGMSNPNEPVTNSKGGLLSLMGGGYLSGATDGMADKIDASIEGEQPAALSDGEFVVAADVVSHLGNGNSDAGAEVLYDMMSNVRKERTGTTRQGKQINPNNYVPQTGIA